MKVALSAVWDFLKGLVACVPCYLGLSISQGQTLEVRLLVVIVCYLVTITVSLWNTDLKNTIKNAIQEARKE